MWKDFKDFAMRGNVMDLAIAVVIGAAFGKIVTSLVDNIIMPLIGAITGGINLKDDFIWKVGNAKIEFGLFLQSIIDFLIIAFAIFMALRVFNKYVLRKREEVKEDAAPEVDTKEELLKEIRDLLRQQNK